MVEELSFHDWETFVSLDLFRGLALAIDDFRRSLTDLAVMVDLGVAKILKRFHPQFNGRFLRRNTSVGHGVQELL